jgi:hypothetical protein
VALLLLIWKVPATKIGLNLFLGGFLTGCSSRTDAAAFADDVACYAATASFHVFSDYMFADPIPPFDDIGQATNSVVK